MGNLVLFLWVFGGPLAGLLLADWLGEKPIRERWRYNILIALIVAVSVQATARWPHIALHVAFFIAGAFGAFHRQYSAWKKRGKPKENGNSLANINQIIFAGIVAAVVCHYFAKWIGLL